MAEEVSDAVRFAGSAVDAGLDIFGCVVEVSLTLLDGASVQGGPPVEVQNAILYVTGQHSWVHKDIWVLDLAHFIAVLGAKRVICCTAPSLGNLRRKVVLAAALGCAPFVLSVQIQTCSNCNICAWHVKCYFAWKEHFLHRKVIPAAFRCASAGAFQQLTNSRPELPSRAESRIQTMNIDVQSKSKCQCCRSMPAGAPEALGIDGDKFVTDVLLLATTLSVIAEKQQGQDPQPNARLAVASCLCVAQQRMCSGLPFVPGPQQCIMLMEVAARVMASFAAAPEAASAASVLLPAIGVFLTAVSITDVDCTARQLAETRRSLTVSVQAIVEGPLPLLTAAGVSARGLVIVGEAATSIMSAISIAAWISVKAFAGKSRLVAQMLQQCQALLADHKVAAQLEERQHYPQCSFLPPVAVAAQLASLADCASHLIIRYLSQTLKPMESGELIGTLADCQQQLLALSSAVALPPLMHASVVELKDRTRKLSAYEGAELLAEIAKFMAEAVGHELPLISQPASLAATVASGAVSALTFAALDSSLGSRPADIETKMPSCMQYATDAVTFLHVLAQQLFKPSRTNAEAARSILTTHGVPQSLVQLLLWLSEPTTAVATASGVLSEALPALRLMAADEEMGQMLAVAGAPHEWEPVAAALRRRLPRRMAARFLRWTVCQPLPPGAQYACMTRPPPKLSPLPPPRPPWQSCCRCAL